MEIYIGITQIAIAIICVLAIAALLLAVSSRFGFPFTIALVLTGIGLTNLHEYAPKSIQILFQSDISPDLILYICLPALIFESALNLHAKELRNNIKAILFLAIPGLLISTFIIGIITHYLTNISLSYSFLLGSILSATDPVAVISIFKKLGAPKKLTILVEGESLFNDATSIVTSKIILTVILSGTFTA
ncbi:MAG: cation:proton antiporter, partial [Legionellales bacterium]|nr:cation:proton antiporter [Legionellales bacterium]